jgi:hypothetical protein
MASWATKSGSVTKVAAVTSLPQKTLEFRVLCHVARIVPPYGGILFQQPTLCALCLDVGRPCSITAFG